MIDSKKLLKELNKNKISFFTGVPDSILKFFSKELENQSTKKHILAVNEGSAVATGIGYYLSTKKIPCIYFQNSGLGNAINPLISIAHKNVYSIPLLLLIGWRGSPKKPDEPQHTNKGKITLQILKLLNIKYIILRKNDDLSKMKKLINEAKKTSQQVACLIEKETLIKSDKVKNIKNTFKILRSEFIYNLLKNINTKSKIISTTGYTSRELYQIRKDKNIKKGKDFYMVGGMGHSGSVAAAYSCFKNEETICLDGDGSLLMHMGSIFTAGNISSLKFKYILLNNNVHESVGNQKTNINQLNIKNLSLNFNFKNYFLIKENSNMNKLIKNFLSAKGPSFLEVRIKNVSMKNLVRPKDFIRIKNNFIN